MKAGTFLREVYRGFLFLDEGRNFPYRKRPLPDGTFDPVYGEVTRTGGGELLFQTERAPAVADRLHRKKSRFHLNPTTGATKCSVF